MNRRKFIKKSSLAVSVLTIPTIVPSSVFGENAPGNRINIGFIGTGRQGLGYNLPEMLKVPGIQVTAVCDLLCKCFFSFKIHVKLNN